MIAKNQFLFVLILLILSVSAYSQKNIDLLILNKNYEKALKEIDSELNRNSSADLYLKQGLVFNRLQKYQQALSSYSNALQLDPDNVTILGEMADGLSVLGNNRDAISFYKKAIELDTTNLVVAGKLGRVYINLKELKNAYNIFAGIYAKDSSNVYWNKQFAYCSYKNFRKKQAVHLYEKVLEANPRDYGSYSNLAHAYDFRKENKKILNILEKGLNEFVNDDGLLLEMAEFYFRSKNYKKAMPAFEHYFAADGDSISEIVMNYAISTYFSDRVEKAMQIFDRLYLANPNDVFVMYYKSLCFKKQKNFEEAEKMMCWAIEGTVPTYVAEMYHHLGQIYGQQRKFKESVEAMEKAYQLEPDKHELLFEIATTYEEFNSNKTLALNYYRLYLNETDVDSKNVNYALDRITRIKEDLFFEK
jgi:tetratricopeptide (TPR) repeat protein